MTDTWILYWLACEHQKTYVGITNDLAKRFKTHQAGRGGRFTRAFRPTAILAVQPFPDRASASRAERWLKAQGVAGKRAWARNHLSDPADQSSVQAIDREAVRPLRESAEPGGNAEPPN